MILILPLLTEFEEDEQQDSMSKDTQQLLRELCFQDLQSALPQLQSERVAKP